MGLKDRIRKLEEDQGLECPECGHLPGAPISFKVNEGPLQTRRVPSETCRRCGAVKRFSLNFDWNGLPEETRQALTDCGAVKLRQDAQDAF
jgi:hypothetical protein